MSEKQRGEINVSFKKGFFREFSGFEPVQLYQVYEREIHSSKAPESPVFPDGLFLFYCVAGSAVLCDDKNSVSLSQHTAVFCHADGHYIFEQIDRQQGFRYICLNISIAEKPYPFMSLSELCGFYAVTPGFSYVSTVPELHMVFVEVVSELCLTKRPVSSVVRGLLYQLLIFSYRHLTQTRDDHLDSETTMHAVGHTVYAIIRYVDDHLFSMDNLTDMAKELGYSYNYLSHLFRKKTGMTIQMYVSQKKIEKSIELLADRDLSITEIATMLNYDCIQSFSKAFKRTMNMSPTEYRAMRGMRVD